MLNANGQMTGYSRDANGVAWAFFWNGHEMVKLDFPNAGWTVAVGLNDAGQVIGYGFDTAAGKVVAFFWENGAMTMLGSLRRTDAWSVCPRTATGTGARSSGKRTGAE